MTPEQKRAVTERILAAWIERPDLRLGQTLVVAAERAKADLFFVPDSEIAEMVETTVLGPPA